MADLAQQITEARNSGHSDDDIVGYLGAQRPDLAPKIKEAQSQGYSSADIVGHLGGTTAPPRNVLDDPNNKLVGESNGIPVYKAKGVGEQLADIPAGIWENFVQSGAGLIQAVAHPIKTIEGIGSAQEAVRQKMAAAAKGGDYVGAARHLVNYLIPLVGPGLDESGDLAEQGQWGRAVGQTLGTAAQIAAPEMLKGTVVPLSPRIGVKSNLNPVEQANQAFLEREGVDTSLSMQTGSRTARNLEGSVRNEMGGSGYAENQIRNTRQQIRDVAQQKLGDIAPGGPVTPLEAGDAVLGKFKRDIRELDLRANEGYSNAWQIENDPANMRQVPKQVEGAHGWETITDPETQAPVMEDMPLPHDMRPMKMALKPIASRFARTLSDTDARASLGLKTMREIIAGPDFKPVSQAEADLGLLKKAARTEKGLRELRNESQGLAAFSVGQLQQDVDNTVAGARGGQQAIIELQDARRATAQKWGIYDQARKFGNPNIEDLEPVGVFNKLTGDRDVRLQFLRRVRAMAPAEMPKVGRALIEETLNRVFREGDISHTQEALNSWDAIGPEAKKVFFRDPQMISDIDNLMLGLKRLAKEPNPSGSGYIISLNRMKGNLLKGLGLAAGAGTGASGGMAGAGIGAGLGIVAGEGMTVLTNAALARLLYNPKFTRALRQGVRLQLAGDKVGAAALAAQMVKMAGKDGQPVSQEK